MIISLVVFLHASSVHRVEMRFYLTLNIRQLGGLRHLTALLTALLRRSVLVDFSSFWLSFSLLSFDVFFSFPLPFLSIFISWCVLS